MEGPAQSDWGTVGHTRSERELELLVIKSTKSNARRVHLFLCASSKVRWHQRRPLTKSVSVLKVLTSSEQIVNASQSKITTYAGMIQEL